MTTTTIEYKLFSIQQALTSVGKSGYNSFNKYKYVQLTDILSAIRPHLLQHKLLLTQSMSEASTDYQRTEAGDSYLLAQGGLTTTLIAVETGESISSVVYGCSLDKNGDKSPWKTVTGLRKYGLLILFGLDTTDDPEHDSNEVFQKQVKYK